MFMAKQSSFEEVFSKILLKEANGEEMSMGRPRRRPRYDDTMDREEFDRGIDPDIDPSGYDVEGLGDQVISAVDDTTEQVIQWADEIESFTKRLLDPENPEALLTKLSNVTNIPEYSTAAEAVAKHLRKAVSEIAAAKTELDVLASMANSRRNARKMSDQSQVGPSGPY